MNPAPSVILFTCFSGIGFGLFFFLSLGYGSTGWIAATFFAIAYSLSIGGLLASTFHLGHPERALKAFTQWRSSWLSREGCCAVVTLLVMTILGFGRVIFEVHWYWLGLVGAAMSLATVITTAMIYAQLKSVPRWNLLLTPFLFIGYSAIGGALLVGQIQLTEIFIVATAVIQLGWWTLGDQALAKSGTSLKTATGLGDIANVRAFEAPHTGPNYLTREMVFVIARRHAKLLRFISVILAFGAPVILLNLPFAHFFAAMAIISHIGGVLIARWLFFAEAEHVVGLYYGAR
ncbi:MAG: dimethyl sulfoxide reductase anchor subunit [Aestuariivita sp.]|nr:dimethyl sulfoxide reductase anchor subunit [Aestuariivita sp.]